jgi:MerR family transcriptional regulator, redox-sensitive transcriptional activator SoxR
VGMTIGEVAARTGVRTSALRFYEDAGVLPPAARVSGQRRYDEQLVRMIEVLGFAQRAGFTLAEIRTLFQTAPDRPLGERWKELAGHKLPELDRLIAHAQQMKEAIQVGISCGCVRLDDCIAVHSNQSRGKAKKIRQGSVRR